MVKVKIFGVIRTTTGFSYLETEAKTVNDIFEVISWRMAQGYQEDKEELEKKKNDPRKEVESDFNSGFNYSHYCGCYCLYSIKYAKRQSIYKT